MQDGVLTIRGEKRATRWGGSCGSTLPSGASLPKDSGEVDMPDRSLALLVVAIVLLLPLASVRGAEPHDPVPGYTGGYHEHAADWSGARITQNFERCCGKKDCVQLAEGGATRNPDGSYTVRETVETFAWDDPQLQLSRDGTYWRCRYETDGHTRCLFRPATGLLTSALAQVRGAPVIPKVRLASGIGRLMPLPPAPS
jgi:hypothetical protein